MSDTDGTDTSALFAEPGRTLSLDVREDHLQGTDVDGVVEGPYQATHRRIRNILSRDCGPMENIRSLLEVGAESLSVGHAHLVRIDPAKGSHEIVEVSGPHPAIEKGQVGNLAEAYCRKVVAGREALAVRNAGEQGWEGDRAYEKYGLSTYLGAKVVVDEDFYGTLCFVDSDPREEPIGEEEQTLLSLLVGAIQRELGRRKRRERVRRTGARLEALFEESPDMISVHARTGAFLDANYRLREATGYGEDALDEMTLWDLVEGPSLEETRRRWTNLEAGDRERVEARFRREDGSDFPVEIHLRRFSLDGAERLVAISHDISGRKKREHQLRRQNDLFQKAQALAHIGAWEYVIEDDELNWTDEVYEIYGLPKEVELTPEKAISFFHPEDRPSLQHAFSRAVESGVPYDVELRLVAAGGETRWVRAHGEAQTQEGGISRVRGTIQDITDRKRREHELRAAKARAEENEELFCSVMENAPVMIEVIDEDGRIKTVSDHFEEVLGWTEEDLAQEDAYRLWELMYPDPDRRRQVLEAVQEAPDKWQDFRTKSKRGDRVDSTWTNVVLSDGRRLGLGIDITDRKRHERELRRAKEKAEEAARLKTAMLTNMSHEVRTPLTAINGFAEILKEELQSSHQTVVEHILRSGKRLMNTLDSVLRLSKLEAGGYELDRVPVDLSSVAEQAAELYRQEAEENGVSVEVEEPGGQVEAHAQKEALNRIADNLVGNAIKFTPEGGAVTLRVAETDEMAILEVEDTGVGISEENQSEIFQAFKQESQGLAREFEGAGLGLSIVGRLVDALDGTVRVQSEKGSGSRFTVQLPAAGTETRFE